LPKKQQDVDIFFSRFWAPKGRRSQARHDQKSKKPLASQENRISSASRRQAASIVATEECAAMTAADRQLHLSATIVRH
jgi:hypothetical protein